MENKLSSPTAEDIAKALMVSNAPQPKTAADFARAAREKVALEAVAGKQEEMEVLYRELMVAEKVVRNVKIRIKAKERQIFEELGEEATATQENK
jgi:hypothetical protein